MPRGTSLVFAPCPIVQVGASGLGPTLATPSPSASFPPLLTAQLEGLAGGCSCLLAPLLPKPSFLLLSQHPTNYILLWVNHPGLACCLAGPFLLLGEEQICHQSEPTGSDIPQEAAESATQYPESFLSPHSLQGLGMRGSRRP